MPRDAPRAYNPAELVFDNSMMNPRFFCPIPLAAGSDIDLPSEVAHHADRVMSLRIGCCRPALGRAVTLEHDDPQVLP